MTQNGGATGVRLLYCDKRLRTATAREKLPAASNHWLLECAPVAITIPYHKGTMIRTGGISRVRLSGCAW